MEDTDFLWIIEGKFKGTWALIAAYEDEENAHEALLEEMSEGKLEGYRLRQFVSIEKSWRDSLD